MTLLGLNDLSSVRERRECGKRGELTLELDDESVEVEAGGQVGGNARTKIEQLSEGRFQEGRIWKGVGELWLFIFHQAN